MKTRLTLAFVVLAILMTNTSTRLAAQPPAGQASGGKVMAYGNKYHLGVLWEDATFYHQGQAIPCVWISFVYPDSPASKANIVPGFLTRVKDKEDKRVHNTREAAKALDDSDGTVDLRMFVYNAKTGGWDRKDLKDVKLGQIDAAESSKKIEP